MANDTLLLAQRRISLESLPQQSIVKLTMIWTYICRKGMVNPKRFKNLCWTILVITTFAAGINLVSPGSPDDIFKIQKFQCQRNILDSLQQEC